MAKVVSVAAIDIGASSGRVMVAEVGPDRLETRLAHRFPNGPVAAPDGTLRWDVDALFASVVEGLRRAGPVDAIGIDTWAVDYGVLGPEGDLIDAPYSYRDPRGERGVAAVRETVSAERAYAITGIAAHPFNTVFQLAVDERLRPGCTVVLMPDLIAWHLTGTVGAERTNASTTGLVDATTRTWSAELIEAARIPADALPPLRAPGTLIGSLTPRMAEATGQAAGTPVVAVGSHDTASAVVAVPFAGDRPGAFVSSGTWSLVGQELAEPVLSERARQASFTNEAGVGGTVRFLRNVTGLWVLSEAMRAWGEADVPALVERAGRLPAGGPVIDVDDPAFVPPGDMGARIAAACEASGHPSPRGRVAVARCILDSLALAQARAIREAVALSGTPAEVVHIVGGGANNAPLCQLTADASGLPVLVGPVEATALGNSLVAARAIGVDLPDLAAMRDLVRATQTVHELQPNRT